MYNICNYLTFVRKIVTFIIPIGVLIMKLFRKLICLPLIALVVICGLTGCKTNQPPTSSMSITLNEAKNTIINALEIPENAQLCSFVSLTRETTKNKGNRNIFAKMSTANVVMTGNFDEGQTIEGKVQRAGKDWKKFVLATENSKQYYDGTSVYSVAGEEKTILSFDESLYGIILQSMDCMYLDLLFLDEAWDTIYADTVEKTHITKGYVYTFNIKMANYVEYVTDMATSLGLPTEGLFGDKDSNTYIKNQQEGSTNLIVTFDNSNHITKLQFEIVSFGSEPTPTQTSITVSQEKGAVQAPDWFNISDFGTQE